MPTIPRSRRSPLAQGHAHVVKLERTGVYRARWRPAELNRERVDMPLLVRGLTCATPVNSPRLTSEAAVFIFTLRECIESYGRVERTLKRSELTDRSVGIDLPDMLVEVEVWAVVPRETGEHQG